MAANVTKPPRKLSAFHYYIKMYYHTRIKDEYNRRYALAKSSYDDATVEDKESGVVTMPVALQLRTNVCMEFWNLESQEFRDQMGEQAENEHLNDLAEWKERQEAPKTPQEYHQ